MASNDIVTKAIIAVETAIIVTLVGGAIAWRSAESDHVTREELLTILQATIQYPYLEDKGIITHHLTNDEVHQTKDVKRQLIRDEVALLLNDRLGRMEGDIKEIKDSLRNNP